LKVAGIRTEAMLDGSDLFKLVKGERIRDFAICETWGERCIIKDEWKLIIHYEPEIRVLKDVFLLGGHYRGWLPFLKKYGNVGIELYNIREDPAETINLAEERKDIVNELRGLLDSWVEERLKGERDPILLLERYTQPQTIEYQRL
ncbi:MAG: hypothetical protein J7L11_09065, partial [Thermoprotei archaeon]|nr:hypothetical protein [Thermoprotei archaeon]